MNTAQIAKFCTSAVEFVSGINAACVRFEIADGLRLQHFLAQCAHESAGFTRLEENLNYSAEALHRLWPNRFTELQAQDYARHPERIANKVYSGRMGNGPEASGEGWLYRGRGIIQLTGKENYHHASLAVFGDARLLTEPDAATSHATAPLIAGWYWESRACNQLADTDDLDGITRKINGGLNGIDDRQQWLDRAKECFA